MLENFYFKELKPQKNIANIIYDRMQQKINILYMLYSKDKGYNVNVNIELVEWLYNNILNLCEYKLTYVVKNLLKEQTDNIFEMVSDTYYSYTMDFISEYMENISSIDRVTLDLYYQEEHIQTLLSKFEIDINNILNIISSTNSLDVYYDGIQDMISIFDILLHNAVMNLQARRFYGKDYTENR